MCHKLSRLWVHALAALFLICAVMAFFACAGNEAPDAPDDGGGHSKPDDGEDDPKAEDCEAATQALFDRCVHDLKFELKNGKRRCDVVVPDDLDISSAWLVFLNSSSTVRPSARKSNHDASVQFAESEGAIIGLSSLRAAGLNTVSESPARRHKPPRRIPFDCGWSDCAFEGDAHVVDSSSGITADDCFLKDESAPKSKGISEKDELPKIGSVRSFKVYYDSVINSEEFKSGYREVSAELKHSSRRRTVNGERTLLLYLQEGLKDAGNLPSSDEFAFISDCFFDVIYPLATQVFGSDEGEITGNSDKTDDRWCVDNIIGNTDELALLFCDIDDQGPDFKDGYVYGFFDQTNYIRPEAITGSLWAGCESSGIPLICLHAYKAGGEDLGTLLLTIIHEFQHLIHGQHLGDLVNSKRNSVSSGDFNADTFVEELFSNAIEELAAKRLMDYAKEKLGRDLIAEDPFCVLTSAYGLEFGAISPTEPADAEVFRKGKGPYVIDSFDSNISAWHDASRALDENERDEANRKQLVDYGRAAAFAHYILMNYGVGCFKEYLDKAVPGFNNGLIPAIARIISAENEQENASEQSSSSYSIRSFIKDFAVAALMSGVSGTTAPLSFNKASFAEVAGMKIPSVNLHQYYSNASGTRGIRNSHVLNGENFDSLSINYYSVLQDVAELNKGDTISIILDSALASYIDVLLVLVPTNDSILDFN